MQCGSEIASPNANAMKQMFKFVVWTIGLLLILAIFVVLFAPQAARPSALPCKAQTSGKVIWPQPLRYT
jgi:hypothetical protein